MHHNALRRRVWDSGRLASWTASPFGQVLARPTH